MKAQIRKDTVYNQLPIHLKPTFADWDISFSKSLSSRSIRFIGKTQKGKLSHSRISLSRFILGINDGLFYYTLDIDYIDQLTFLNKKTRQILSTKGWAVAPFGFKYIYTQWHRFQPVAQLLGGFVYFQDAFPDDRGLHFNFTYELSFGIEVPLYRTWKINTGYTFFHHSNAEFGKVNPGMDLTMFSVGFNLGL